MVGFRNGSGVAPGLTELALLLASIASVFDMRPYCFVLIEIRANKDRIGIADIEASQHSIRDLDKMPQVSLLLASIQGQARPV